MHFYCFNFTIISEVNIMKQNNLLKISLLMVPLLFACNKASTPSNENTSSNSKPEKEEISVIVLAGQSNMEGNTWSKYVSTSYGFTQEEVTRIQSGYEDIQMSYRCFWNGNPNGGTDSYGLFESVRLGQANTTNKFGPEIGIADYLTEQDLGGKVALIKYAVGASALDPAANEWGSPSSGRAKNGKWYDAMLELVSSGLETLEIETGKKPVIKAMCWMQGEADSGNASYRNNYFTNLVNFVGDLRSEWEMDSKEGGFTFIDAFISQYWNGYTQINAAKSQFEDFDDNSELIDTISAGLDYSTQPVGNVDYYHYDASSMFKLGRLFGEKIKNAL